MGYRSMQACVSDLEKHGHLIRLSEPVDPHLEMAEIQRRIFQNAGPAVLFENVVGCKFRMVSNLFGSIERSRFMFRDTLEGVRRAIELKIDPSQFAQRPFRYWKAPLTGLAMRPKKRRSGPILSHTCRLSELPQLKSWPMDGGPFVTLPQVYSEDPGARGLRGSNLGMYRIQLAGNDYEADREIGLHYQIHRGIGVHHQAAKALNQNLPVNIFVGGSPAMTLSAVMPLPEGMSELTFAGALSGHRIGMVPGSNGLPMYGDADFVISGSIKPGSVKPEGPFGDHLGYYSLVHDFPVMEVTRVHHRPDAIWPFTVVGRPPQEDTQFGELIHELTGPIIPTVLPGVKSVHAVDAAGVHPLLLAVGSERYTPYSDDSIPMELLTQANAILGQGQMSLAKYLWIANAGDSPGLECHDIAPFFAHALARIDWTNDVHFQTRTTMDTLDYSGDGINRGSKVVLAARGPARFELLDTLPTGTKTPDGFSEPRIAMPGVVTVQGPKVDSPDAAAEIRRFCESISPDEPISRFRMIVIVDDSDMTARTLNNFLWVTFTRSNPAADIDGVGASIEKKHWGCKGPLVIDARIKPHHAPPLVEDTEILRRVDALAAKGLPISKYL